jgi:hypothetical protein
MNETIVHNFQFNVARLMTLMALTVEPTEADIIAWARQEYTSTLDANDAAITDDMHLEDSLRQMHEAHLLEDEYVAPVTTNTGRTQRTSATGGNNASAGARIHPDLLDYQHRIPTERKLMASGLFIEAAIRSMVLPKNETDKTKAITLAASSFATLAHVRASTTHIVVDRPVTSVNGDPQYIMVFQDVSGERHTLWVGQEMLNRLLKTIKDRLDTAAQAAFDVKKWFEGQVFELQIEDVKGPENGEDDATVIVNRKLVDGRTQIAPVKDSNDELQFHQVTRSNFIAWIQAKEITQDFKSKKRVLKDEADKKREFLRGENERLQKASTDDAIKRIEEGRAERQGAAKVAKAKAELVASAEMLVEFGFYDDVEAAIKNDADLKARMRAIISGQMQASVKAETPVVEETPEA